jgi:hypothetical protein
LAAAAGGVRGFRIRGGTSAIHGRPIHWRSFLKQVRQINPDW